MGTAVGAKNMKNMKALLAFTIFVSCSSFVVESQKLSEILGDKAPSRGRQSRVVKTGRPCTTPDGKAGTCQFPLSAQCSSILQNPSIEYILQAIKPPCGFQWFPGFDFTFCCANQGGGGGEPQQEEECGISNKARSLKRTRIINGEPAKLGQWPWAVVLGTKNWLGQFQVRCGGTLLNRNTVLSAAHCFDQAGITIARIGDLDVSNTNDGASHVDINIAQSIQHPNWNPNTNANDIAILKLSSQVTYTENIKAACLPEGYKSKVLTSFLSNNDPFIIGWGVTSFNGFASDKLRMARVPIFDQQTCANNYASAASVSITDSMVCAGDGNKDTCSGDSGGALLSDEVDKKWSVIGVTSFGLECAREDFPGVYTRVDKYLDWIKQNM